MDAVYCHLNERDGILAAREFEFVGSGAVKSARRAETIVSLCGIGPGSKVALIGLIVDIARCALEAGGEVRVADFAEAGSEVLGLGVQFEAAPLIPWADTLIVTGNTLKTDTLERILKDAVGCGKKVLVYAMTAHHIAARYLDYGVDVVTAEGFPYYWYAGTKSTMKIYSRR
jgi:hypothetical protein